MTSDRLPLAEFSERNVYRDWLKDLLAATREFDRDDHIDAADFLEWFSEWRQETLSSEYLCLDYQPETPEDDDGTV